jgi:predicted nucleotidyltransferase
MKKFSFIGGTNRGYELLKVLLDRKIIPEVAFILKEDDHELERYSEKISAMLTQHSIPHSIKKKLLPEDYQQIESSDLDFIIVYGWRTLIDTRKSVTSNSEWSQPINLCFQSTGICSDSVGNHKRRKRNRCDII